MKRYIIRVNNVAYDVEVEETDAAAAPAAGVSPVPAPVAGPSPAVPPAAYISPAPIPVPAAAPVPAPAATAAPVPVSTAGAVPENAATVTSPMPGTILRILVNAGDAVKRSQPVVVLEAMKMENEIVSTADGKVLAIHTTQGASVNAGDPLVSVG